MTSEIRGKGLSDLRELLDQKKISSVELTKLFLKEIDRREEELNAFVTVTADGALAQAQEADRKIRSGNPVTAITGIPIAVKDVILVRDVRATASSKILGSFVSPYDSTVAHRLRAAGAVFLGKTNCDEFAMGSSNENSAFGPVRNPWNTKYVPGGSSGGSAAAIAAYEAPVALGTDTGGSIRQPAALCGVTGLKPTYGRVSRYGVVAFASSLDQVGPMARRVDDLAILLEIIGGHDERDSTSSRTPIEGIRNELAKPIRGLRIGYPKEYLPPQLSPEVRESFETALRTLEKEGATVEEISLPHTEYAIACYYIVATAEASANLARYDGIRYTRRAEGASTLRETYVRSRTEGFGPEVRRRILLGTYVLSSGYYEAYYLKAQKVRTLLRRDFDKAFEKVDVIASPTSPTPAFELGSKSADPLEMYLSDIFTVSISLAGLPALSVPCGFTKASLPLGLQLIGRPFDEATILRTASHYEAVTRHYERMPPA